LGSSGIEIFLSFLETKISDRRCIETTNAFRAMTHAVTPISHLSEASRHIYDAEARIARQQELAEVLQRQGHEQAARQAREILAMFVKSYFVMHHYRQTLEFPKSIGPA
jgi:hypothetical protein